MPSSPGHVVPVADVAGLPAGQVCVGSSVNSSYEDLAVVAGVLREHGADPGVELTVTPGSREILDAIVRGGVYGDLVGAGARMLEPACGPCIGVTGAPAPGVLSVRTFNRNFPGRSGTTGDAVALCSPSTAAATAVRGAVADPRALGRPPRLADPPPPNRTSTTARSSTRLRRTRPSASRSFARRTSPARPRCRRCRRRSRAGR
jgi:aconitate hydratase